jgi:hypothetical protein
MKKIVFLMALLIPGMGFAQQYSIDWHKVAGGGGTSSGGNYSVSGTIGQHDASGAMTGGSYSLTGGFWSLFAVQTPGAPTLTITRVNAGTVVVSWPAAGGYNLQENSNLATTNWLANTLSVTTANGTNSVTISPPTGNLFFRLAQ